jgi:hypothetical protein
MKTPLVIFLFLLFNVLSFQLLAGIPVHSMVPITNISNYYGPNYQTVIVGGVTADFNNDGIPDYAMQVKKPDSAYVNIYFGSCAPTLTRDTTIVVSYSDEAKKIMTSDLNNDGNQDLILLSDTVVSVFLGTGNGLFTFSGALFNYHNGVSSNTKFDDLVIGDFDNDGVQDLLASWQTRWLVFAKGHGNGTFDPFSITNAYYFFSRIFTADINHDSKIDLIAFYGTEAIEILNDSLNFQNYVHQINGPAMTKEKLLPGSYNGKTRFVGYNGSTVYSGLLDTTFDFMSYQSYTASGNLTDIAIGRFNNDTVTDLILGYASNMEFMKGNANGTFNLLANPYPPEAAYNIHAADLNNDSIDEIIYNNVSMKEGFQNFNMKNGTLGSGSKPYDVAAADFNLDGNEDVASVNYGDGTVTVFMGGCNGFNKGKPFVCFQGNNSIKSIIAGNFNTDSFPDLAVTDMASHVRIHYGNGDGTFQPAQVIPLTGNYANDMMGADLNNDGWMDLVVAQYNNIITVMLNNAGNGFTSTVYSLGTTPYIPQYVHVEDYDGDGFLDIGCGLVNCPADEAVMFGNGTGTFTNLNVEDIFFNGLFSYATTPLYYDHDSHKDLAIISMTDNLFQVCRGGGPGAYSINAAFSLPVDAPTDLIGGDFNNDGFRDFLVTSASYDLCTLYGQKPDGSIRFEGHWGAGDNIVQSLVHDMNHDGKPDFLCASSNSNDVSIFINDLPDLPNLVFMNDTIFCTGPNSSAITQYQWYYGDTLIPGQTSSFLANLDTGTYWCTTTITNGGFTSNSIQLLPVYMQESLQNRLTIFPNPVRDELHIRFESGNVKRYIELTNLMGQILEKTEASYASDLDLDVSGLSAGIYFILLKDADGRRQVVKKICVE